MGPHRRHGQVVADAGAAVPGAGHGRPGHPRGVQPQLPRRRHRRPALFEEVRDYVASISPELADRVEWAGDSDDPLPVFERYHVHEQIHKALDRKVWLPRAAR